MTCDALQHEIIEALKWYADHGVHDVVNDEPHNRLEPNVTQTSSFHQIPEVQCKSELSSNKSKTEQTVAFLGKSEACDEAIRCAKQVKTLEELSQAIKDFEGIAIKKTASNMVFSDGNPQADIMIVGEAPGADEDRLGKPFAGLNGQLLDRILDCIDLSRTSDNPKQAVYLSNILNWRPPGNRTPSTAEIEISLPFIEKHIQLVAPKILLLCGGVAAKSLLGRSESISRLRKSCYEYVPQTPDFQAEKASIPAIATYHPSYLLRTPLQKKLVWEDMISLRKRISSL